MRPLVAVLGPTGSGKSHLALELALRFNGEIVNCDSLQLYRGLDIGTAKTPLSGRRGVPHHLLDILEPEQVFNAGDYAALARPLLAEIAARGRLPVVAGGTGFYLHALLKGLAKGPKRDDQLRRRLSRSETRRPGVLHRLLRRIDPETARRIHPNDRNKTLRALEICLLARRPAADLFRAGREPLRGFSPLKLVLQPDRALLRQRLLERTRAMFGRGLLEEIRRILDSGVPSSAKAFESIGYKEGLAVLEGRLPQERAIELAALATRQYAKRQITWFRRETGALRLDGFGDDPAILARAAAAVAAHLAEFTHSTP